MIAPPETIRTSQTRVACDGATDIPGGAALGHPRVFLQIDEHGYVDCGYCDRRFVLIGGPADGAVTPVKVPIIGLARAPDHPISVGMTSPTDPRPFLYRYQSARSRAKRQALTADASAKADDGELYLQYRKSEAFGFDDGRLKTADYDTHSGFGLRAVSGETTAFAHANEI